VGVLDSDYARGGLNSLKTHPRGSGSIQIFVRSSDVLCADVVGCDSFHLLIDFRGLKYIHKLSIPHVHLLERHS
jgi:hypothetical protein